MARDDVILPNPPIMAVASGAILIALINELINQKAISREGMERVLGVARDLIGRTSTQGAFGEARGFVALIHNNLPPE